MTPRGRSAPLEMFQCCDNYADPRINPRHLWSEHDDTRSYVDPDGWAAHVAQCDQCQGDSDV